jgi:L-2-hydroxyglutarate oxidase LhgO
MTDIHAGKLIVATDEREHKIVEHLLHNGNLNGVPGLEVLTGAQVGWGRRPSIVEHIPSVGSRSKKSNPTLSATQLCTRLTPVCSHTLPSLLGAINVFATGVVDYGVVSRFIAEDVLEVRVCLISFVLFDGAF